MKAKIKNTVETIDTGLVEFKLPFDRGEVSIFFNPNDTEFYYRISKLIPTISELYEEAETELLNADDERKLEIFHDYNGEIVNSFNEAFGNDVSNLFKFVSPLGIIKSIGQPYMLYILEWLLPRIADETDETAKKAMAELEKAQKQYSAKTRKKMF